MDGCPWTILLYRLGIRDRGIWAIVDDRMVLAELDLHVGPPPEPVASLLSRCQRRGEVRLREVLDVRVLPSCRPYAASRGPCDPRRRSSRGWARVVKLWHSGGSVRSLKHPPTCQHTGFRLADAGRTLVPCSASVWSLP